MSTHSTATPEIEKRVVRKVTLRLLPFLALLYFVNYLDRVNIGFAGPNGLTDELAMSATMFGLASGIFFLGYLLLEVPSNLLLHRFGARVWLTRIMVTWGLLASAMALVPNAVTLVILRFLLGVAEAGFFPGIILYLTYWFPAAHRARMVALFMVAVPVSTAIGSTLSALIMQHMDGFLGLSGWRVMFLVEGIPALILAVVTFCYLTDRPDKARWLAEDERGWLTAELTAEREQVESEHHWPLRRALTHPRIVGLAFVYFGIAYGLYALGFFLPTIVDGFQELYQVEYSTVQAGLITAVPYVVGAVAMVLWARHGDRTRERVWHVALPMALGGIAIPIAMYLGSPLATMIAVTVCAAGVCAALPTFWALPSNFLAGSAAAGGIALINSIGNISGFAAPYVTGALTTLTGTERAGLWVTGGCMLAGAALVVALGAAPKRSTDP